jgi:hypothetical protein
MAQTKHQPYPSPVDLLDLPYTYTRTYMSTDAPIHFEPEGEGIIYYRNFGSTDHNHILKRPKSRMIINSIFMGFFTMLSVSQTAMASNDRVISE